MLKAWFLKSFLFLRFTKSSKELRSCKRSQVETVFEPPRFKVFGCRTCVFSFGNDNKISNWHLSYPSYRNGIVPIVPIVKKLLARNNLASTLKA